MQCDVSAITGQPNKLATDLMQQDKQSKNLCETL